MGDTVKLDDIRKKKDVEKSSSLHTLIPKYFIWKDIKTDENCYIIYLGEESSMNAIKRYICKMKTDDDKTQYPFTRFNLRYVYEFIRDMFSRHITMCIPQMAERELSKPNLIEKLVTEEAYTLQGKSFVFSS
jgi:hypothetical protein